MNTTVTPLRREVTSRLPGRAILPHRSYRTTHTLLSGLIASLATVVVIEVALAWWWQGLASFIVRADAAIVNQVVAGAKIVPHTFFGQETGALLFKMPAHTQFELYCWMIGCALVILFVSSLRRLTKPLQYFINVNAIIIGLEAAFLLLAGHLGYSAADFSQLLLETMIVTWFIMPLIIGAIALLFPFNVFETVTLIVFTVAYVVFLDALRYAVFPALLSRTGPILMSDLFLLYGPLLDIIPVIGIFGIALAHLSARLRTTPEAWRWL